MSAYCAWLYEHPRLRRAWLITQLLWGGSMMALLTAPHAVAAGFAGALNWPSPIVDTYDQPVGTYFISTVSMLDAIRTQGSDVSIIDPGSWIPALTDRFEIAMTYSQLAVILGWFCGFLVMVGAVGIWFIKIALGSAWLGWLAALAAPVLVAINNLVGEFQIIPLALIICVFIGGIIALTKGFGRGAGVMCSGFLVILLIGFFLNDPVKELGDNGLLAAGRAIGFELSLGIANNGSFDPSGNAEGQVEVLSQWMATTLIRHPIQIANFGGVIDNIDGCAQAWNAALNASTVLTPATQALAPAGAHDGPVQAMRACGASDAYAHAHFLSGETIGLMFFINCVVLVVLMLLCYIGCEVIRIGFKAFWNVLVLVPAAAVAVAPGPQREFAKRTAIKLIVHALEMLFATAAFGIVLVLMSRVSTGKLDGFEIQHPIAILLLMLLFAGGAVFGFRALMRGFGDRGLPGPMSVLRKTAAVGAGPMSFYPAMRDMGRSMRRDINADGVGLPSSGKPGDEGTRAPAAKGRKAHPNPGIPAESGASPSTPPPSTTTPTPGPAPATGAPAGGSAAASTAARGAATGTGSAAAGTGAAGGAAAGGGAAAAAAAGPAAPVVAGAVVASKVIERQQANKSRDNGPAAHATPKSGTGSSAAPGRAGAAPTNRPPTPPNSHTETQPTQQRPSAKQSPAPSSSTPNESPGRKPQPPQDGRTS
ncbi:hypothetical protein PXJ67_00330 (plasmid) [Mycobacteroides chelonae]|jgi:hypothetical protein|uniref:TrbL/VirB6 plasmid conjugal transfer protein n=1 Tax=Mycolicibacterium iranicum TaxID=912594 RepID=A0A178LMU3_MYCIR|nr:MULTISPECIES: hypothetical protein [Mycobacteriaceae]OAN31846.1 hypothetical protein A4X20_28820 [Mycolicibacterium iranicum]WED89745.1 hypothetical protein PXJ67_00330 [Mycobacteroides chelonae]